MFYQLVAKDRHGHLYSNSISKKLSFNRAMEMCNEARTAGDIYAVVLDTNGEFMVGVTPWGSTNEQDEAMIKEAVWFGNIQLPSEN